MYLLEMEYGMQPGIADFLAVRNVGMQQTGICMLYGITVSGNYYIFSILISDRCVMRVYCIVMCLRNRNLCQISSACFIGIYEYTNRV